MKKLLLSIASLVTSSIITSTIIADPQNLQIINGSKGTSYMQIKFAGVPVCTPALLGKQGYTEHETNNTPTKPAPIKSSLIKSYCANQCQIKLYWDTANLGTGEKCTPDKLDATANVDWSNKSNPITITKNTINNFKVTYAPVSNANHDTVTITLSDSK